MRRQPIAGDALQARAGRDDQRALRILREAVDVAVLAFDEGGERVADEPRHLIAGGHPDPAVLVLEDRAHRT